MRKRQEDEAGRAQEGGVASAHGPTPFEEEENNEHQWDVGIGNLIIDLDADIASSDDTTVMPSSGGTGNYTSTIEPPHQQQQQQQQQGLLKMKIKRSRPSPGTKQSEAKHEIVKNNLEMNGSPNQNDANRRPSAPLKVTNGVPGVVIPATGVTVTPIMRIPTVKSSPLLTSNGSSMTVTPLFNTAAVKTGIPVTGQPTKEEDAAKKTKAEACVGTSDVLTMTEPDCLGPCEPGTQVSLDGIVWQETEGGVLVVNVTWRGKTYVGTLLDCTSHDWAPPRFCDSPSSDTESRVSRGRAAKRGRGGASNSSTPVPSESPFSPMHSKLRLTVKGRRGFPGAPPSPAKDSSVLKRKAGGRFPEEPIANLKRSSRSPIGELPSQPGSPTFIECPEPNCSKKYRHINGLRYHQSHAHGGVASPTANNDAEDLDEEPAPEETKLEDINEDSVPVGNVGKNEEVAVPVDSSVLTASQDSRNHPEVKSEESQITNGRDERKETSADLRNSIPEELEMAEEQREEVQSPAYSDISEPNDQTPEETNDEISEDLNKKVAETFPTGTFVSPFYPQTPFMTPQSADDPKIIKDDPKLLPKPSPALGPFLHSYDFYPDPSRKNPEKEVTIIKETRLPPKRENPPSPKFRPATTVVTTTLSNERGKNEGIKPTMESHGPPSSVPFPYSLHPFSPMIPSPFFSSPQLNFLQTSPFYAVALPKAGDSNSPARPQAPQMKIEKSVIAGSKPLMSGGALQVTASTHQGPGPVGPLIPGPPFPSPSTYAPGKPILRP